MSFFTSVRERRLWLWTLLVMMAIYSTLGVARTIADGLRERNLLAAAIIIALLVLVGFIAFSWIKNRPDWKEIVIVAGVAFAYFMVGIRINSWEERTHLIEYGIVAALIYEALLERGRNSRLVLSPAAVAVTVTAVLGLLDEGIQGLLPNRIFDFRDVFFNALAGFMIIAARLAIAPQRGPGWRLWFLWLIAEGYGWGTAVEVTGLGELSLQSPPLNLQSAYLGVVGAGMLVGTLQWLILYKWMRQGAWWILASAGSGALFGVIIIGVNAFDPDIGWATGMCLIGLITGLLQWIVIRKQLHQSGWWIIASTVGWLAGIPAGEMVGWNGLGAIHGLITGAALVWLLRHPVSAALVEEK